MEMGVASFLAFAYQSVASEPCETSKMECFAKSR